MFAGLTGADGVDAEPGAAVDHGRDVTAGQEEHRLHAGVGEHAGDRHPAVVLGHGRGDPRGLGQQRVGRSSGGGGLGVCGGLGVAGGQVVAAHGR